MIQTKPVFTDYSNNFQLSNFKILKLEDFFENACVDEITKNHKVNFYTIILVTNDIGRHTIDYKDFYFSQGTIITVRKNQTHKYHINNRLKGYVLFFNEEFLNNYLNELEISSTLQMFNELLTSPKTQLKGSDYDYILNLVENLLDEYQNQSDSYSIKITRSLLHILISQIHRYKSKGYDKVLLTNYLNEFIKFQNLLEENYKDSKKVSFYSNELGFSTKKLNTITKYVANKNAKVFIDDVVIIKSKRDLLHSDMSIKQIAYKLGFKEPTNFFKYFRKHTGFTPESFKKRYKK